MDSTKAICFIARSCPGEFFMKKCRFLLTSMAAFCLALPGSVNAATFLFSFESDSLFGNASGGDPKLEGLIENAVDGNNFGFDLVATITAAADPASLGSGYKLLYLSGSNPAFKIEAGKVVYANAIFSRKTGGFEETLTLYSGSFFSGIFRSDGVSFSGQFAESAYPQFGDVVAAAVPEPSTWVMLMAGLGAVGFAMRHQRRRSAEVNFI